MDDDTQSGREKVVKILSSMRMAMVTSHDEDGGLVSRPMAMQQVEFDGDLWFFAGRGSSLVSQILDDDSVNVSAYTDDAWISVRGRALAVEDQGKKDELWNAVVAAWFPQGPDLSVVLVKVAAEAAEYWESAGGRVATAVAFIKSKVTGDQPDVGSNETVEL